MINRQNQIYWHEELGLDSLSSSADWWASLGVLHLFFCFCLFVFFTYLEIFKRNLSANSYFWIVGGVSRTI